MKRCIGGLILIICGAVISLGQRSVPALASAPPEPPASQAYCEYVESSARADAAALEAPQLFTTAGVFNAQVPAQAASPLLPESNRTLLLAGIEFSLANAKRGIALKRAARADCDAYRISSQLESFLQSSSNSVTTSALASKAAVLRTALAKGTQLLAATNESVANSTATVQEADAMRLRLDELRRALADAEREAAQAMPSEAITSAPLQELLQQAQLTQMRWYKAQADVREASAWDFTFRSGYDHFLVVPEGRPFFATGNLTFNLGAPWQKKVDKRTRLSQEQWFLKRPDGVAVRTMRMIRRLKSVQDAEAERLEETQVLMADLEQRMQSMQKIGGRKAQSYADYLWFDYIKLKAEDAFLRAHLRDLAALTGDDSHLKRLPASVAEKN
jgi:hypothetical protein